jgi:hypothetical protein
MPVGGFQDALGQMMSDETVNAEDEDFLHFHTFIIVVVR